VVCLVGDAGNKFEKDRVLFFKTVIKALGDPFYVKPGPGAAGDIEEGEGFFLLKRKGDGLKFLDKGVSGLGLVERVFLQAMGLPGALLTHCQTCVV